MRAMKDSGIEWIGEIPGNWSVERNKQLFYEVNDRCENGNEHTLLSVSEYFGIAPKSEKISDGEFETRAETLDGYKLCKKDDIVMNIMLAWKRATGRSDYNGIVSPAYCVYRKKADIDTHYYHYLFRTDIVANLFKQYSTGIIDSRLRLYPDKFLALQMIVPPLPEQQAISSYLDRQCAHIDNVIEKTKASIEEYKKLRQAVITQAVTKGVKGERPMKDSGIEWIGEIPVDWSRTNAHRIVIDTQNGLTRRDLDKSEGQIVLKLKNISASGEISYNGTNRIELSDDEFKRYSLQEGDFLFVRVNGTKSLVGKCAIYRTISEPVAYNDHIIRVRLNDLIDKKYFQYYLLCNAGRTEIDLHTSTAAGQFTISGEGLRNINIIIPSIEEQKEIADYLDKKCTEIDTLITKKETFLTELEAYKKSLIYEYVTGKKEVPQA